MSTGTSALCSTAGTRSARDVLGEGKQTKLVSQWAPSGHFLNQDFRPAMLDFSASFDNLDNPVMAEVPGNITDVHNELYEPSRLPLECGWRRLDDGTLAVSALHRLPGCTWQMVKWWLVDEQPYRSDPDLFIRWHPKDHIGIEDDVIHQRIGGVERAATMEPLDLASVLDLERLRSAGFAGASSGRTKPLGSDFAMSWLVHVGRDTDVGLEIRSRFFLGETDPPRKLDVDTKRKLFGDDSGAALLQHTLEEYAYLGGFLPELYALRNQ